MRDAGIPCLADASWGYVQMQFAFASGRNLVTFCKIACSVHSFPKFCMPKLPKKLIVIGFNLNVPFVCAVC
jgi:hypothetical protein